MDLDSDPDSLSLIAQMLEEELRLSFVQSTLSVGSIPAIARADLTARTDRLRAEQVAREYDQQKRSALADQAFARALQQVDDEGGDVDDVQRREATAVLGEGPWRALVETPVPAPAPAPQPARTAQTKTPLKRSPSVEVVGSSKGKGKVPTLHHPKIEDEAMFMDAAGSSSLSATAYPFIPAIPPADPRTHPCAICFEACRPVADPFTAALAPGGSSAGSAPYGSYIGPRDRKHVLCLQCGTDYLHRKVADRSRKTWPVKCVEVCFSNFVLFSDMHDTTFAQCPYEFTDVDAQHILGKDNMEPWHYNKLLDSLPPLYCPNKHCSARVVRHEDPDEHRALCPSCQQCICVSCETIYHNGMSCEQFQALPAEQRENPEDISLHQLAATKNWKRCPGCRAMIERTQGCWHMTCDCGKEWCWGCEGGWIRRRGERSGRCAKNPPCDLWGNEDDLLDAHEQERERERQQAEAAAAQQQRQGQQQQPPAQDPYPQQPQYAQDARIWDLRTRLRALEFVRTAPVPRHQFTAGFIEHDECGYCQRQFANPQALQQHLASASHDVYACSACDRLYRARAHLDQHLEAGARNGHEEYVWEP
ncbi:hypothetical protein JCM11251_002737 [Rhodosporidiobolus azoricus]